MLVVVDSRYRNQKLATVNAVPNVRVDGPESYDITMKVPVKDGMRVLLRSVVIPKSIYPVITGFNDTIDVIRAGPTVGTIVIPGGRWYTGQQLSDAINTATGSAIVTWSDSSGKLTWLASTGLITLSLATTTPANRYLIGSGTEGGIVTDVELPWCVDLSYPRWLRLNMTFGVDRGHAVMDTSKAFTFQVAFSESNFGDIESNTQGEQWLQRDPIPDINVSTIKVEWMLPDDSLALSMNGCDHQIVLEVL